MADKPKQSVGLEIEPVEGGYNVYEPGSDRVHYLNFSAALILGLCDGHNSPEDIANHLKQEFELEIAPIEDVIEVLTQFSEEGLLEGETRIAATCKT